MHNGSATPDACDQRIEAIVSPYDIPDQPLEQMARQWADARTRSLLAAAAYRRAPDTNDLLRELAYATRIAQEVVSGRWCVVAELLRTGEANSWPLIGTAIGMTGLQAKDGFHAWVTSQNDLRHKTGSIGFTDAEAIVLHHLAEAVAW